MRSARALTEATSAGWSREAVRALRGARAMLRANLALGKRSEVLVVTDERRIAEVEVIAQACQQMRMPLTSIVVLTAAQSRLGRTDALPNLLRDAVKHCHAMIVLTGYGVETTPFRMGLLKYFVDKHRAGVARALSMPGVRLEHFGYALANAREMDRLNARLSQVLVRTTRVTIETHDQGRTYRLEVPTDGRPVRCGSIVDAGDWDNVPTGETYVLPKSASSAGEIAIDGSLPGRVLSVPVIVSIAEGRIVSIDSRDPEAARAARRLFFESYPRKPVARNALRLAEVGFGVNRRVRRLHGVPVVDEKMYGTAHVGFGRNDALGGRIRGVPHYDLVCLRPRVLCNGSRAPLISGGHVRLSDGAVYLDWRTVEPAFARDAAVERSGHDVIVKDGELVFTVMHPVQKVEYRVGTPETGRLCASVYRAVDARTTPAALVAALHNTLSAEQVLGALEVLRRHRLIKVCRC